MDDFGEGFHILTNYTFQVHEIIFDLVSPFKMVWLKIYKKEDESVMIRVATNNSYHEEEKEDWKNLGTEEYK